MTWVTSLDTAQYVWFAQAFHVVGRAFPFAAMLCSTLGTMEGASGYRLSLLAMA